MGLWRRSFLVKGLVALAAALTPGTIQRGRARASGTGAGAARMTLRVQPTPLKVLGKEVMVLSALNPTGGRGLAVEQADGFQVDVINNLRMPTGMHWHGLLLPNGMDGVPFITQNPIPPGGTFRYEFQLRQAGTYWMHSHYGMQEQHLLAAPLVIWSERERAQADQQFVVMISDFSFRSPQAILKELRSGSGMAGMTGMAGMDKAAMGKPGMVKPGMAMAGGAMEGMAPGSMAMASGAGGGMAAGTVLQQVWDESNGGFTSRLAPGSPGSSDVNYDALLANHHTIDNAEILAVKPGETVLLRLIGGCCATNVFLDSGDLEATVVATDGNACEPLRGNFFQLAIAQRLDLRFTMPQAPGVFPILMRAEGKDLLAAVVLSSAGPAAAAKAVAALPGKASQLTGGLDGAQESRLRAQTPLSARPVDRNLELVLAGSMQGYRWTINGESYPNRSSLMVRQRERVAIHFENRNGMGHPMHLHGHVFQVVEINGKSFAGPLRDTVLVPAKGTCSVLLDADQPGLWAFHCHIMYHAESGMFTTLLYEGADTSFWQPEKMAAAMEIPSFSP